QLLTFGLKELLQLVQQKHDVHRVHPDLDERERLVAGEAVPPPEKGEWPQVMVGVAGVRGAFLADESIEDGQLSLEPHRAGHVTHDLAGTRSRNRLGRDERDESDIDAQLVANEIRDGPRVGKSRTLGHFGDYAYG